MKHGCKKKGEIIMLKAGKLKTSLVPDISVTITEFEA